MAASGRLDFGRMDIQQFPHVRVALAAIPAHVQAFDQLLAGAGAFVDGLADLAVSHGLADADIHSPHPGPSPSGRGERINIFP